MPLPGRSLGCLVAWVYLYICLTYALIMDKDALLTRIISRLEDDYAAQLQAAKTAHATATHEENIPDNKYATLGLEASYLAQGYANRAQEIRHALQAFRQLTLHRFYENSPIRQTALVQFRVGRGATVMAFFRPIAW